MTEIVPERMTAEERTEKNFMGTAWDFYVTAKGKAFWVNTKTGTVVPSSRNGRN